MNCANHPERTATAFCQNCGKPLCPECTRTADGLFLCEPCLLARQAAAGTPFASAPAAGAGPWTAVPQSAAYQPGQRPQPGIPAAFRAWSQSGAAAMPPGPPQPGANPVLAGFLGIIPGVGAMYNGQFIKALLHVVIFIVLIGAAQHFDLLGLLVAAWIFYQVFDAAQTASARRDGRPLPDPFGILDMSQRMGTPPGTPPGYPPPYAAPPPAPHPVATGYAPHGPAAAPPVSHPAAAQSAGAVPAPYIGPGPAAAGYGAPGGPAWTTPPPAGYQPVAAPYPPPPPPRGEPIGAIVLISVGLLFLLSTLGILNEDWIGRGWPILILLLGLWLLFRRVRTPEPALHPPPVAPAPATAFDANPLSITTQPRPHTGSGAAPTDQDTVTGNEESGTKL